ncbi:hydrolase [Desulfosporosinus sp. HMP52]|uniref:MBL fold metallo-hydrolase n=1 Tax=Desulfosporosinus sp. HMP52 TaxID=1487923 RepID=UPI00051FA3DC|nr:MBL fold metallo-hydrolase [Desulfosporosinus sp. HMP52]KGK86247.1 hydrolase [Desulfosporosinus sp. HMP52]
MTNSMRIKYLYHSGFLVETNTNLLIFDYYQGSVDSLLKESPNKNIFIFSSHSHPDHFNPIILEWHKFRPDIQYIFSNDINVPQKNINVNFIAPYQTLEIGNLSIKAYNSTDLGVAFLVQDEEMRYFHAGDLNWWYWIDTPEEMIKAEKNFKEEIQKIKGEAIDVAFFPVDPRLELNYSAGAEYFIQELTPRIFIPMHFADSPDVVTKFETKMKDSPSRIIKFSQKGQELIL